MKKYFLFALLVGLHGCGSKNESVSVDANMQSLAETTAVEAKAVQKTEEIERKLIKEGTISFETEDLEKTKAAIKNAIVKFNGYTSSDQESKYPEQISNTVVIRVPSANFDKLLEEISKGVIHFDNKDIQVKDVTEEFLDIEARVKTKKELELRYLELLKKANTVSEILEVEKQIGELRAEIESIEGRLNYLTKSVNYSTLTITFYKRITTQTQFVYKFSNGFKNGWENLILFFVMLANIWPFVLIVAAIVVYFRFYRNK